MDLRVCIDSGSRLLVGALSSPIVDLDYIFSNLTKILT